MRCGVVWCGAVWCGVVIGVHVVDEPCPVVYRCQRFEASPLLRSSSLHADLLKGHGIGLQLPLGTIGQAGGVRGGALHGAEAAVGARGRQLAEGQRVRGSFGAQRRVVSEQRLGRGRGAVRLGVAKVVCRREVELGACSRAGAGGRSGGRPRARRGSEARRAGLGGW